MNLPNAKWLDPKDAPKDGTILVLLVRFKENSTADATTAVTIGSNHFNDNEQDEWLFAGWDWNYDEWTAGLGEVIGWWPLVTPEVPVEPE
ncbi:hypothetical protein CNR34_00096 [Pseudomonas phage nickie]|uniref:Uncharacterized protein n=1 Tax=Pseudomonas phage nickie TaxID=2048977 RepID=A0A2H4P789_9CAUD|nr:hypothetical protein FDJ16_gp069 [Pseudomonas phage nickie]ATW58029.1 hypothetical protein CNR34_00096 [Pseudomonas phage nickie]